MRSGERVVLMRQHSVFPVILSKEWGEGCFNASAFGVSRVVKLSKEWGEGCFDDSAFGVSCHIK